MTDQSSLRTQLMTALRAVLDPELGINIVDLGLVYEADVDAQGHATVKLTMTSPACPLGEHVRVEAEQQLLAIRGLESVQVELVWEPLWSPDRMSLAAKELLGWAG
ncbi:MAG TPA: metal-sulfur cluster assembly factor [Polyangiaceae bacterium]|nr:metal-sulfur cluster assembly factor [Polyangiaceae bacterium]